MTKALLAAAVSITALSLAPAVATAAVPAGCVAERMPKGNGMRGYCTNGGWYRMWTECRRPNGTRYWSRGAWETKNWSEAYCASNEFRTDRDVERG